MTPRDPATQQYLELAELAGGFIHEIKNHINTLSLNLQLLAEDFENPQTPRERKALDRVTKLSGECRRLVELSNDFLRFARVADLQRTPTVLADVVTRMVDFLAPTARIQGVEIDWYPTADLPLVSLDAEMFEKVLLNLMLNAEDAMPDGGTLTLQQRAEGSQVVLDVIDTGAGMDAALADRIFQPFVTTKPGGTGLGLATAQKIVLAHGGTIEVQSEPGRGTKFTIRLSAVRAE
ncbi:two-component system sensor histidine kinase NtrB [Fimbriiglobus ruber]|uniref:histidine kinase n=1 Tax=Fimbriiglobus ruber TaxID=1908690 RepID=A0A225E0T5_9BACT|nr:ATP-binding protein [Fimbriiglobus ruber]OWK44428.1 integral membrane sensor signal transduction histidine kinase [Fimbriiglobus ruber]